MSSIDAELLTIKYGVYGEDIRDAIYDALETLASGSSSSEVTLSGQDFTTQAEGVGSISFYGTDTTTLADSLPATNGIDTSLVTNEVLKIYLGTPIGIGNILEIEFGDISVSADISSAVSFLQSYDYGLWEYGITSSGDIVSSISSDVVANITDLADNTLKITCDYVSNTSGVLNLEYNVYIGDTLIDTVGGDLGGNGVNVIVGLLFSEVGTDALNAQIKSIYVKAE